MQTNLWFVTVCLCFNGGICGKKKRLSAADRLVSVVFVAKKGHGEKVVIKKLLSEDDQEKHLFIKEAKILHHINSAMML